MKKAILILSLTGGLASAQVEVSAAGLQVVAKGYSSEGRDKNHGAELRAFNWSSGTKVSLLLKSEGKSIVNLDRDGSEVTVFSDDQGTDFTKSKNRYSNKAVSFGYSRMSEDKLALITEVETAGIPKSGSKSLVLKGELMVSLGSKSALKKSKAVELKKGGKFVVGENVFEITKAGKPDWGDDPLTITLKSSLNHKDFKAFVFYDAEGKEIKSDQSGSSSMGGFGKKTYTVSFNLKKEASKLILGLDEWTDLEVVKVPLDLKVEVGL